LSTKIEELQLLQNEFYYNNELKLRFDPSLVENAFSDLDYCCIQELPIDQQLQLLSLVATFNEILSPEIKERLKAIKLPDNLNQFLAFLTEPLNRDYIDEPLKKLFNLFDAKCKPIILAYVVNAKQLHLNLLFQLELVTEDELKNLGPYLRYVDVRGLFSSTGIGNKFDILDHYSNINILLIDNHKIEKLPPLPYCELLSLNCKNLIELPPLPNCKRLSCFGSKISVLPDLPLCGELSCGGCVNLTTIQDLPKCKELNCHSCVTLTTIQNLPSCEMLNCQGCFKLTTIQDLPKCKELDCSRCTTLTTLPQTLPSCQNLNCEGCQLLTQLPELPYTAQVYGFGMRSGFAKFEVDVDKIAIDPKYYLLQLGKNYLLKRQTFPNVYYFHQGEPSLGIDIGGLRRDFITRLFENLFKGSKETTTINLDANKLYPVIETSEDAEGCRTIGSLFALCFLKGSYFKVGEMFGKEYFQALQSLGCNDSTTDKDFIIAYTAINGLDDFQKLSDSISIEDFTLKMGDLDLVKSILEKASYFLNPENPVPIDDTNLKDFKIALVNTAKEDSRLKAAQVIVNEMKSYLPIIAKDEFFSVSPLDAMVRIQGVLTKELLIRQIDFDIDNEILINKVEPVRGYLINWINQTTLEDLKQFVRAISGNATLGADRLKIMLYNWNNDTIPSCHSCFFTLDVSGNCDSQTLFNSRMKLFLEHSLTGSGFQFG